jgi:hypothetical protein
MADLDVLQFFLVMCFYGGLTGLVWWALISWLDKF